MAIKNPMFQKAVFQSLSGEEQNENHREALTTEAIRAQQSLDGVNADELAEIKKWARILRLSMLAITSLMIATALLNVVSSSTSSVATSFIALYVFFFSILMCCYECGLKQAAMYIVQNFGFMYNPTARMIFTLLVSFLCFELSTIGIVCFALLIAEACVQIYVYIKHPKYSLYMKKLHFYDKVLPGGTLQQV